MRSNAELLELARTGDAGAADELVKQNMGLVYSAAGRFINRYRDPEDLVQIGAMGLIKAVKKFDSSFGVQFSTYAVPMIIGEIKRFLRDDGTIKVSRSLKETALKGRRTAETLRRKLGREPSIKEISEECGISGEDLIEAFEASAAPESLQSSAPGNDEPGRNRLMDRLASEDTEEKIVDKVFLKEAMAKLNDRERSILIFRYYRSKTQSEIAAMLGISQVQVSRIEKRALGKIRENEIVDL